jgi:hypothetical protein
MAKPLISLCMIVGNVQEYIERCLKSFAPLADEIVLVTATGNQDEDGTIAKAHNFCRTHGIDFVIGKYHNQAEHSDWPHVDSFAAARQMSFDLATGQYCFWCDSDDVLESGAKEARELAERGGFAAFVFPYRIFGRGLMVPRERMILKGAGQWRFPVHECFKFHVEPVQAIEDQRVVVKHLPHATKTGSNPRNLTILNSIPKEEMTTGLWYHLHLERELAGDTEGSIEAAKIALAAPDIGKPEKYEIFLNMAQASGDDPAAKEVFLHQAYQADARRREALFLLTSNALNYGQDELGLAYARQMMATRGPEIRDWNDRAAVYGWAGDDIYTQALRANGRVGEAEFVRAESMKRAGGPRIALIHATRGRARQASKARKMWLDLAERPDRVEHLFVIDDDDEASFALERLNCLKVPAGGGCVAAWNAGAFSTVAPVLVQMSDDFIPPAAWDELILQRLGDVGEAKVLAVSDGLRTDKLLCIAIMTRAYLALDWFMFHPNFTGVYSDNWFTSEAYRRNAVIEARDLVFMHDHPAKTGAPMDETYLRQNNPERYEEGRRIKDDLYAKKDWASVPGFFNYWPFYDMIARLLKSGDTAVEVGCWLGRSIIFLAQRLKPMPKLVRLFAVDHFRGETNQKEHEETVKFCGGNLRDAFEANLQRCGVTEYVGIIEADSAEAAARFIGTGLAFVFIDAAHDYESVKRDIAAWLPKMKPGGIIAGHDIQWHEVDRAVTELLPKAMRLGGVWFWKVE